MKTRFLELHSMGELILVNADDIRLVEPYDPNNFESNEEDEELDEEEDDEDEDDEDDEDEDEDDEKTDEDNEYESVISYKGISEYTLVDETVEEILDMLE